MKNFKASIRITLRESILDVQGKTVESALESIELAAISGVRIGKFVSLNVEAESKEKAFEIVDEACKKLIANPIIEDYSIEIEPAE